ncbi:arginase family protein [Fimbriiglobus ruber]|uniref:Agmatinase n=1 Tax=Fimbriiglobus ruber TaxID=1908690 RepID=A0A225DFH1_9BACT|nr:arginase family protein [Fimbriiglobus ruber]OWK35899.1 Agmatinase [Fimbriiglobus ruber]
MNTTAVVFPFDNFGAAGTGAGAQLLGDAVREILEDTAAEDLPTRPHLYAESLRVEEHPFETLDQLAAWRATGREAVKRLLAAGDRILWLAGNHLGVLPVYEELGPGTLVIQLDAHLDCYDLHDCTEDLSHGNFLLHAEGPLPKIVNVGNRDLFLLPEDVKRVFSASFPAEVIAADFAKVVADLRKRATKAARVWIDIDVDVFDPAFAPAVHNPSPFGLAPPIVLALLGAIWSDKVVGVSVSEFDPGRDARDATLNVLGWLIERILLKWYE